MEHVQQFRMGYFYPIVNTCASKWTLNGKLKLKLVRPEKKQRVYDAQTCKNANPAFILDCHFDALLYERRLQFHGYSPERHCCLGFIAKGHHSRVELNSTVCDIQL